jgi:hypothetical protein
MEYTKSNPLLESILHLRTVNREPFDTMDSQTTVNSHYNDQLFSKDSILQSIESKITSNRLSVYELEESTQSMYKRVYAIFVGVMVVILIGLMGGIRSRSEKVYMVSVAFILFSYVLYLFYFFNWMYVRDGIQNIRNALMIGKIDTAKINLNPLPQQLYMDDLCRKKKAAMNPKIVSSQKSEEEEDEKDTRFISSSAFRKSLPDNRDVLFYNDGDAPKLLQYPTKVPKTDYGMIYYPDHDSVKRGVRGEVDKTYQL